MYDIHVVTKMFFFLFICYPQSICSVLTTEILNFFLGMRCTQIAEIHNSIVLMYQLQC
jgi:hypothetical protein